MTSLAVHAPAWLTVPAAIGLVLWIVWYYKRMGAPSVPESRRRIRRASVLVMLVGLPFFVQALSFLDPDTQPEWWATTWLLVMFCLLLVVMTAALDIFNTFRLVRRRSDLL